MIDIHHHLLFGLDDGSNSLQTSVDMARLAVAEGITHIVCSPHANSAFHFDPAVNAERLNTLREALARESLPLTLGLGCDFHLSFDNLRALKQHPPQFTINGMDYLLVELPDFGIPGGMTETFYEMQLAGLAPILTHPERNPTLQTDLGRLAKWLRGGLLVQVTADSILGNMGRAAERMSHQLLEDRWVHFVATDAHNLSSRPPRMRKAFELVAKRHGDEFAERIFITNPKAAFDGKPLPAQDEPIHLHDDMEPQTWWGRIRQRYGL